MIEQINQTSQLWLERTRAPFAKFPQRAVISRARCSFGYKPEWYVRIIPFLTPLGGHTATTVKDLCFVFDTRGYKLLLTNNGRGYGTAATSFACIRLP